MQIPKPLIIGIDPDLDKSGVAVLGQSFELKNLTFAETVELFRSYQDQIKKVVIEAGWMNKKSNLHSCIGQSKRAGERIAKNVGENHATGKLLVEMAESLGLAVVRRVQLLVVLATKISTLQAFNEKTQKCNVAVKK